MSGMKESYSEGMASHAGLRSYAGIRESEGGTLIEVRAGRVSSREIARNRGADVVATNGRQHQEQRTPMLQKNPARSKTPSMHGNIRNGNWEIPRSSAKADRVGKFKDIIR
jgi:hypothetical protein